jgi:hypothetical protein
VSTAAPIAGEDAEQQDDGAAQAEQRLAAGLLGVLGHCELRFLSWVFTR